MCVESGSPRIRKEILNRLTDDKQIIDIFKEIRQSGIKTVAFNMIGLPTETEQDIRQTIELNKKIKPSWIILSLFTPFPGTRLFDFCKKELNGKSEISEDYYKDEEIFKQISIDENRVRYYYHNFIDLVYNQ